VAGVWPQEVRYVACDKTRLFSTCWAGECVVVVEERQVDHGTVVPMAQINEVNVAPTKKEMIQSDVLLRPRLLV
jgi:hypothetical protein